MGIRVLVYTIVLCFASGWRIQRQLGIDSRGERDSLARLGSAMMRSTGTPCRALDMRSRVHAVNACMRKDMHMYVFCVCLVFGLWCVSCEKKRGLTLFFLCTLTSCDFVTEEACNVAFKIH